MNKRKSLSNKTRFEVFKRDSFTCQYCGGKAPEIVLNVDHIKPLSKGGTDDIMNLVTSCFECNNGKRDRELNDDSVINKQREQMELLNERKNQLEMMMNWREELEGFSELKVDRLVDYINKKLSDSYLTETGIRDVGKWLKTYDFDTLLDSVDIAFLRYGHLGDREAFIKIERIAYYTKNPLDENIKRIYYIRGILRNRISYINQNESLDIMRKAYAKGVDIEDIEQASLISDRWSEFVDKIKELEEGL